jgi:hypothetical protein
LLEYFITFAKGIKIEHLSYLKIRTFGTLEILQSSSSCRTFLFSVAFSVASRLWKLLETSGNNIRCSMFRVSIVGDGSEIRPSYPPFAENQGTPYPFGFCLITIDSFLPPPPPYLISHYEHVQKYKFCWRQQDQDLGLVTFAF